MPLPCKRACTHLTLGFGSTQDEDEKSGHLLEENSKLLLYSVALNPWVKSLGKTLNCSLKSSIAPTTFPNSLLIDGPIFGNNIIQLQSH